MTWTQRFWRDHQRQIKSAMAASVVFFGMQAFGGNGKPEKFAQGHILVQPKSGLSDENFDQILSKHGASKKSKLDKINVHMINVPPGQEEKIADELTQDPNVKFAEVDAMLAPTMTPNDPSYGSEWFLPKINAPAAWDVSRGDGIVIAILDSGVMPTHPDLMNKLVPGYNFYDNNTDTHDVYGHGTEVAGVAAAAGNDSVGVSGVAMNARIMPMRISDLNGYGSISAMASGLTWAADHGARVANFSYAIQYSSTIISAAQYFQSKGGLVVNSAGNSGALDSTLPSDYLISVPATDTNDNRASFSTYGPYVDVSAPGTNMYTTNFSGSYSYVAGTSFSSPTTAGVIALMMAAKPGLPPAQLTSLLLSTATDLGTAGWDQYYGYGRVNAAAAVAAAKNAIVSDTQAPSVSISGLSSGSVIKGLVAINVNASDNISVSKVDLYAGGTFIGSDSMSPYAFSLDTTTIPDGNLTLTAKAYDQAGNSSSASITVSVRNTVDSTAPVVTILTPAAGTVLKGNVSVQASASDNVGVTSMTLYMDGAAKASSTSGSLSYTLNARKLSFGVHTIRVDARDAAGNMGTRSIQVSR